MSQIKAAEEAALGFNNPGSNASNESGGIPSKITKIRILS